MVARSEKILISKDKLKHLNDKIKTLEHDSDVKLIQLKDYEAQILAKDELIIVLQKKIMRLEDAAP